MSTTRSLTTGRPGQRRDGDLLAQLVDPDLAGQAVAAVDQHRVGAADAVAAGAPEGERAVDLGLDRVEQVEHPVHRLGLDRVALPVGRGVALGVEAQDAEVDLHALRSRAQYVRGFGSKRVIVTGLYRSVGPRLGPIGERVLQPVGVVALGVVLAGVGAAALRPGEGRGGHRLGAVEQVAELARLEQVRVEDRALVPDADAP